MLVSAANTLNTAPQGVGIGLRFPHIDQILAELPAIPWLEAITDNYLTPNSIHQNYLLEVAEHYPMTLHGVGMSLGATDALNTTYLKQLKTLMQRIKPAWVSDHLCWTGAHGWVSHDLLPLPYNAETLKHVVQRIQQVQDFLGMQLVIENVSSYLQYQHSDLTEWEFIAAVAQEADCNILLDINNIYVNAFNHQFDPLDYLSAIPVNRVQEMHLAGYEDRGTHLLDTHGQAIHQPVWDFYHIAVQRFGHIPTLIEWDNNVPSLARLMQEAALAQQVQTHDA